MLREVALVARDEQHQSGQGWENAHTLDLGDGWEPEQLALEVILKNSISSLTLKWTESY